MKLLWLPITLFALPLVAAGDPAATVEFGTPAQFEADVEASGLEWAALVFHGPQDAGLRLTLPKGGVEVNHTSTVMFTEEQPGIERSKPRIPLPDQAQQIEGPMVADIGFKGDWSSLVIYAEDIQVESSGKGAIERARTQDTLEKHVPRWSPRGTIREAAHPIEEPGVALALQPTDPSDGAASPFVLRASGIRVLEWHNATLACRTADCPDSGGHTALASAPSFGKLVLRTHIEMQVQDGSLSGQGNAHVMAFGGSSASLDLDGWARLPRAHLAGICPDKVCLDPAGQAFQAQGSLSLSSLVPLTGTQDRLRSDFQADLASARFDEQDIAALATRTALAGSALVGLVLLAKPLIAFFARKTKPVLENERSKFLHDLVQDYPGLSFTNLKQRTGWATGNLLYHLKRLMEEGLVVAQDYRNTVRYFENHGRYTRDWKEFAVLRDADMRRLHQWLLANPGRPQSALLKASAEWKWSRSATQRRLQALDEAGLLQSRRNGRNLSYTANHPTRGSLFGRLLGTTGGKSAN